MKVRVKYIIGAWQTEWRIKDQRFGKKYGKRIKDKIPQKSYFNLYSGYRVYPLISKM